ncbi:hypothetical protein AMIS_58370 [Actinoplanes missouriensis 431]|uniref:Uncharacterized protein n=1 Tax=Actinoplanes missouriensis (strain ATCC 14538 / DSM 43046 / CBS 188.64 / JCM 3121 / NBRC 102363 / NCIMB 12654 / NRRL B-3342 / UNCC 431) TaxID=512565 RepID=I0HDH0_ACTM4|nr:hypothetical protein AMIS_58370 [Actinoplanes missouriensis 431]
MIGWAHAGPIQVQTRTATITVKTIDTSATGLVASPHHRDQGEETAVRYRTAVVVPVSLFELILVSGVPGFGCATEAGRA